jgi:phage terminase large subunit
MRTERIGYRLHQTLFAKARHKALFGGRGAQKSWAIATYLLIQAGQSRKRIICARQFQNSIRDSSKELIERRIRDLELSEQYDVTGQIIRHIGTGAEFLFLGLERNVESIRSLEGADIVWIEEARTISAKSMEILLPTVRNPNSELIWSWNPELPTDPVDAYFRKGEPPPDAIVTKVSWADNPYFDDTALPAEMARLRQNNYERYRHVWEGEYDISYQSKVFTRVVVGRPDVPPDAAPLFGLDFGFSIDPTVIVKVYHLPATGQLYVAAEAGGRVPTDQLPDMLASIVHDPGDLVRADSARPETIDYLQKRGFGVRPARKGPGSIRDGIAFLQSFELVLDPDCEKMREELRCYSWPVDRLTGQVIAGVNPIDAHNHYADALRYAVSDLITDAPSEDNDGGVVMLNLWGPSRRARDELRWHER